MRNRLAGALVLVAGLAVGGCDNGGGGNDIEFTDLSTRIGGAYCGYASRCGTTAFFEQYLFHSTITDCATQAATYFANTQFAQYQLAIDSGTIVYHGDRAAACLSAFDSLGCGAGGLSGPPAACAETFEGTVADGGACTINEECSPTSFCNGGGSGTACGMCLHRPQIGESCASIGCASDAWCDAGTCAALLPAGSTCTASDSSCAAGLACTSGTCATPTPGAAGEPCGAAGCQTGLVCALSGTSVTCRAPRTDGTCGRVLSGSDCAAGTTCTIPSGMSEGTCGAYPTLGQACQSACAAPARCVNMLCQPSTELFQPCGGNDECLSGICTGGTCQPDQLCTP